MEVLMVIYSKLIKHHHPIILDASVIINILGSGKPIDVLSSLNRTIMVEKTVLQEVTFDPFTRKSADTIISELLDLGCITQVTMCNDSYMDFLDMVSAPSPNGLDDGEAATIAYANIYKEIIAVIDEKKGLRVASERYPNLTLATSLDIFSDPNLLSNGHDVAGLVYSALIKSRMRVPSHWEEWVINLIGVDKARQCRSIKVKNY